MKDYYQILEISKTADAVAIKKAYHSLAKLYHPDVNKGNIFFENKFKEINEAYAILSDTNKKWTYDLMLNQPYVSAATSPKEESKKTYYPKGFNINKYRENERKAQFILNIVKVFVFAFFAGLIVFFSINDFPRNRSDDVQETNELKFYDDTLLLNPNSDSTLNEHHQLSKEEFYRILDVEYKDSGDSTLWKSNEDSLYHVLDSMVNSH